MQMQEDAYIDIIYHLEHDRMRLKGKDISLRLNKLQKQEGALNEYIKSQNEKQSMNIRMTRENQNTLVKAVENVEGLRQNIKLQMACVKVVDLKKKHEDQQQALLEAKKPAPESAFKRHLMKPDAAGDDFKSDVAKTNTNINYMLIEAREQMNKALKTLMSNDSKLTTLRINKASLDEHIAEESGGLNVMQIGAIHIKSGGETAA